MSEKYYRDINTNKDIIKFKLQLGAILLNISKINSDNESINNNITKINNDNENINNNITKINT